MRAVAPQVRPCSLDVPTQNLIASISSQDMFSDAMALMDLGEGERQAGWQGPRGGRG